jgi:Fructose-1,6-bisphosphatase/sedoheptulose 1,7-bisphosphatase and related proteins
MSETFNLKDLAPHFLRATEQAAIASGKFRGLNDKNKADDAAVNAMRKVFDSIPVHAVVAIGEGEMDKAPMLYIGEEMGMGVHDLSMPKVDIAVDPLECTAHCAENLPNSICVLSIAPRGSLLHAPECYMDKIAGSVELKGHVSLDKTVEDNIKSISSVIGKDLKDIKVIIVNRPRNKNTINTLIDLGVQLDLIQNGDIVGAMRAVNGDADLLLGIGSAPEGVISAVAVKGLKGVFQGRMWFQKRAIKKK